MIAVIGCGFWGPNFIRIAYQGGQLKHVVDLDEKQLEKIKKNYEVNATTNYSEILKDKEVKGIIIATPTDTHYELAKAALQAGKSVLVEKPLTTSSSQSNELIKTADEKKLVLMVGHTFLYHPHILKLKEYIEKGELGKIYYICSTRVNLGQIRGDVNAMWNLAPHDISIANLLIGKEPLAVRAIGKDYLQNGMEDVVFLNIEYPDKVMAQIHVSWLDPEKVRKLVVVGSKKMAVFDDTKEQKLEILDKGVDRETEDVRFSGKGKFRLRYGEAEVPAVEQQEPLKVEYNHFINCIEQGKTPRSDGRNALQVVRVLEAGQKSLKNNGERVELNAQNI